MAKGIAWLVGFLGFLWLALFVSAGRLDWFMGWACLGTYTLISLVNFVLVDRDLIRERVRLRVAENLEDARLAGVSFAFLMPITVVVAGLDAGRFGWTSVPLPWLINWTAFLVFAAGNVFASWAMQANRFFSTFVRIQKERGHHVVTNGPYRFVRHPGYAGAIIGSLALPLALGSVWALIPAVIGSAGFVLRTHREDRTLRDGLPGYLDYSRRVRWRLFPGLW
jgi:protein-S-isoprenylcysteine O-methyltransferase Ste14